MNCHAAASFKWPFEVGCSSTWVVLTLNKEYLLAITSPSEGEQRAVRPTSLTEELAEC